MRQGQLLAAGIAVACVVAVVLVAFDSAWPDWTGLKGRTLWDIAELLLVPLSLALVAYLLSGAQRREDRAIAERDRAADRELAAANFSEAYPYRRSEVSRIGRANQQRAEDDWVAALRAASWTGAAYDYSTQWPAGFSAAEAGGHDRSD